jgi:hypothetical protein
VRARSPRGVVSATAAIRTDCAHRGVDCANAAGHCGYGLRGQFRAGSVEEAQRVPWEPFLAYRCEHSPGKEFVPVSRHTTALCSLPQQAQSPPSTHAGRPCDRYESVRGMLSPLSGACHGPAGEAAFRLAVPRLTFPPLP